MTYGVIVHRGNIDVCLATCLDVEDAVYLAEYLFNAWQYDSVDVVSLSKGTISKGTIYTTY